MDLEWLGRYRHLIGSLMRFGNAYAKGIHSEHSYNTSARFSPTEVQVLEYILDNENHHDSMVTIAHKLGITKGALSKNVAKMVEKGLLEKYHTSVNQKNIILRVTDYGKQVYQEYIKYVYNIAFQDLFAELESFSDEAISQFSDFLSLAADITLREKDPDELVLIPAEK